MQRIPLKTLLTTLTIATLPMTATAQSLSDSVPTALDTLSETFAPGDAQGFSALLEQRNDDQTAATIGHLLFMKRHFDKAAWFFGTDAVADPADAVSLNNFAAMLVETYLDAPDSSPVQWLDAAGLAATEAIALAPETAAFHNTLANVARAQGETETMVTAARRAAELAPQEPLYLSNLARALDAAGQPDAAATAMAEARALSANAPSVRAALAQIGASSPAVAQQVASQCNVDFRCQEICPKSIIGGIQSVTCEMENASAQMDCEAGKPYPTAFDCSEDLPDYGILIPGLNSGFSLAVPGFSAHVVVDGEGNVDVRVEAGASIGPLGGYLRADGHYSPSNGASFDNLGGGTRLNILPNFAGRNSDWAKWFSDYGMPPAHMETEIMDDGSVTTAVEINNLPAAILSQ